ncbi:SET domain-containing protein, partial [Aureobasidium melanogenum]
MPSLDIRKCTKKKRNATEAGEIDRRWSGRLLAIKRSGEMNEAAQHVADTIDAQSTRIRGSSSFIKRHSIFASPTSSCFKPKGLLNTSGNVSAPRHHSTREAKPKAWTRIYKNRLVGDAKRYWKKPKIETSLCICTAPVLGFLEPGCGERCLNRVMGYECDPNNCGLGELCTNRDFTRLAIRLERTKNAEQRSKCDPSSIGVELFKTSDRGFGVRACTQFEPREIIVEHTGEIITSSEAGRRMEDDSKDKAVRLDFVISFGCMILDATKGSIARFVNHSFEPNCKMLKRFVKGQPRMALFAGDYDILTGQELTYDYNFSPYSTKDVQEYRCGSSNCRGILDPRLKDNKKPVDKTGKGRVAHDKKRKVGGPASTALAAKVVKELSQKRKVPPMPKGWVYVDKGMEKIRIEEARKDKEIAWLQKEGILPATFR